jgi:hypothetical protein
MLFLILFITPGFSDPHPFTGAAKITREEFAARCGPQVNDTCSLSFLNLQHEIIFSLFLIDEFHDHLSNYNTILFPHPHPALSNS